MKISNFPALKNLLSQRNDISTLRKNLTSIWNSDWADPYNRFQARIDLSQQRSIKNICVIELTASERAPFFAAMETVLQERDNRICHQISALGVDLEETAVVIPISIHDKK
jgi:hypothetical protein